MCIKKQQNALIPLMYFYCDIFTNHSQNTSVELSEFCWFFIHIIQISAQNMECIKISMPLQL